MLYKKIIALISILFSSYYSYSNTIEADSTVKISSAKSYYTFIKDKLTGNILVKEQLQTSYKNEGPVTIPLFEFYNDNSKITTFSCKLNGKPVKDFKPIDSYYQVKDIFYTDLRVNFFALTLPPKSTAEVTIQKTTTNSLYFANVYFSDEYHIDQKEVVFKIPRQLLIDFKELNFEGNNIVKTVDYNEKEDADIITYKIANLQAKTSERYSPGDSYIYPHLLFFSKSKNPSSSESYFSSTQDQYSWYRKLTENLNEDKEPSIAEQAKSITKGLKTDYDKVKAIYYWMQENVRYIAFEDGIAGFRPDKSTEVLRKKYGDCKGMANLTKNLIKSLGIDARLCWLGTNHIAYNYSTPSLAVDNHMICAVKLQDKFYFLDATETYLGFNEYAERIQGRQVLIEDDKNFVLSYVPITNVEMNSDYVVKKLSISGKDLTGKVNHKWKGEHKEFLLTEINSNKKEKIQKSINNYLSNDDYNYNIEGLNLSSLTDYDKEITADYLLNFKNRADLFNGKYYIDLDNDKEYNNFVVDTLKRKHDIWLPYKANIQKEIELKIPNNYVVDTKPDDLIINTKDYQFSISYLVQNDKILYKKSIKISNPVIKKSNFNTWNNDIKKLSQTYTETITLKPKS